MSDPTETFDVVVVGGGPGGSTAASFIAMDGHRVLLLERERFPRYQIGESLLPSTVHGICRRLGVADEMAAAGFTRKRGGTFRWGKRAEPWTFAFSESDALHGAGYAYQVERARFDAMLLENSKRKGVTVRENCIVRDVLEEQGRAVGVEYTDEEGAKRTVRARFVVDASGNTGHLHSKAGERVYSKFFQNVALFGYFENGKRLPAPNDGNILCCAFDAGWFWYIPLSPTLTSVGAVIAKEHAETLKDGHEAAFLTFIEAAPLIKEYLAGSRRATEGVYAPLRVRKDYSYSNSKFWMPGLVLVGDTACFIDPVFSSGVHLATYSALLAARAISTSLRGEVDEERCFAEFEQRYRREFGLFYDFLIGFYDMDQDKESYYWQARKVLKSDEQTNQAFVRLVAGVGAEDDFFAQRATIGRSAEMLVDASVAGLPKDSPEIAKAAQGLRLQERFIESSRLVSDASSEAPLFAGGLVPSADGLRWRQAVV